MEPPKFKPYWHKEECISCGEIGLATRARDVPIDKPYICPECEQYSRGYEDGYEAGYKAASLEKFSAIIEKVENVE